MMQRNRSGTCALFCAVMMGTAAGGLAPWCAAGAESRPSANDAPPAAVIDVGTRDLQEVVDQAPPHSTLVCNPNHQLILSASIKIRKPLTLCGLNARLPEKLGSMSLLAVLSTGVTIKDFQLTGNGDSVSQDDRSPLIEVGAGDFRIENGHLTNSSKDGIMISNDVSGEVRDIVGGVVRDIVGRDVIRDTVSISGSAGKGGLIRNVLVDNVRCYHSQRRGCVEVSDGTDNITVRKVYAEDSLYVIDVQDHRKPSQINRNVVLEDIYALRCKHAIRTDNMAAGHANLTIRDITARQCNSPLQLSNTDNLQLSNVRILDHGSVDMDAVGVIAKKTPGYPISIRNCRGVSVRDVVIENTGHKGPAMLIENCRETLVDGFVMRGKYSDLGTAVCFRLSDGGEFAGLRITNVFAPGATDRGIVLDLAGKKKATLTDYIITGNVATIRDDIKGARAIVTGNLP